MNGILSISLDFSITVTNYGNLYHLSRDICFDEENEISSECTGMVINEEGKVLSYIPPTLIFEEHKKKLFPKYSHNYGTLQV